MNDGPHRAPLAELENVGPGPLGNARRVGWGEVTSKANARMMYTSLHIYYCEMPRLRISRSLI